MEVDLQKRENPTSDWVASSISFGYQWEQQRVSWKRRICIITSPVRALVAPLVTLGMVRRGLELELLDGFQSHLQSLARFRSAWEVNPAESPNILLDENGKKWQLSGDQSGEYIQVVDASYKTKVKRKGRLVDNPNGRATNYILPNNADKWRIPGVELAEAINQADKLEFSKYENIVGCNGVINEQNLCHSSAEILYLGRSIAANSQYMKRLSQFSLNDSLENLADLLTIGNAAKQKITRLKAAGYDQLDDLKLSPQLVVIDGLRPFVNVLEKFHTSDVVCCCSRDEPDEPLELAADKVASLARYYKRVELTGGMPEYFGVAVYEAR